MYFLIRWSDLISYLNNTHPDKIPIHSFLQTYVIKLEEMKTTTDIYLSVMAKVLFETETAAVAAFSDEIEIEQQMAAL